jgi:hypothetical protein
MPGADASQYTRYLRSAISSNSNMYERGNKDRNRLSQFYTRETGANSSGYRQYMPSIVKQPPITGVKVITVITQTTEGGGPSTTTFTYAYNGLDPGSVPDIIVDGGGPGDR